VDFVVVFMGSKKYQNDNDFDAYVTDHGGSSNAFTDCEQVKYMFCELHEVWSIYHYTVNFYCKC